MADQFLERLMALTPNRGDIDRDALLFEMGRKAGRRRGWWPALAGVLALTQVVTLAFFLTRGEGPIGLATHVREPESTVSVAVQRPHSIEVMVAAEQPFAWAEQVLLLERPVEGELVLPESVWDSLEIDPELRAYLKRHYPEGR
jgi:hypothetical protein